MKSYLVAIFVSIVSLDAVGVQCSRDETHVAAAAAATTTAHVTAVDSTLPQERPSACSISVRAWTSDPTPHKAV
ncbi:MAG: hypothetical protein EAZ21_15800 [Betaproteobacteria bacterium]|nr:MAG: hypothetical protein EAZ21_15800 [Betaproteobacteria bacterium]